MSTATIAPDARRREVLDAVYRMIVDQHLPVPATMETNNSNRLWLTLRFDRNDTASVDQWARALGLEAAPDPHVYEPEPPSADRKTWREYKADLFATPQGPLWLGLDRLHIWCVTSTHR